MAFRRLSLMTALAIVASPAAAQTHPNFTGTWILDSSLTEVTAPDRSEVPAASKYVIQQNGDTVVLQLIESYAGATLNDKTFWRIDGKPWVNVFTDPPLPPVTEVAQLTWRGASIQIIARMVVDTLPRFTVERTERWSLAPDRNTLTVRTDQFINESRSASHTLIYRRQ
jgi:hypothetical protein